MKQINFIFGIVLAITLNVVTTSCRSEDDDAIQTSSKRISLIDLEIQTSGGSTKNECVQLSYNTKKQVENIYYYNGIYSSEKTSDLFVDYQAKSFFVNSSWTSDFEAYYNLNKEGFISIYRDKGANAKSNIFYLEYDNNGHLTTIKQNLIDKSTGSTKETRKAEWEYMYSNGNLVKINKYYYNDYDNEYLERKRLETCLIFTYSDSPNTIGLPVCFATQGAYRRESYFPFIFIKGIYSLYGIHSLYATGLSLTGLFGKPTKNLISTCREEYYGSNDYSCRFRYQYDDNGNLTTITGNSTNANPNLGTAVFKWHIEY